MDTPGTIIARFSTYTIMYDTVAEQWNLAMNTDGLKVYNFGAYSPEATIKKAYKMIQDELWRHCKVEEHKQAYPDESRLT